MMKERIILLVLFLVTVGYATKKEIIYSDKKITFTKDGNIFKWSFKKENFDQEDVVEFRLFDTVRYFYKKIDKNAITATQELNFIEDIVSKETKNIDNDIEIKSKHIQLSKVFKNGILNIYYRKAFFTFRQGTVCPLNNGELFFIDRTILVEIKQNEEIKALKVFKFK